MMQESESVRHETNDPPALPPGPRGRRLRNYFERLTSFREFMERLHRDHGDIVGFGMPGFRCCAVFNPDLVQEVLVRRVDLFPPWAPGGREPNPLMEHGCLPVHHGDEHRWRSELMATAFAEDCLPAYADAIAPHALALRGRLESGSTVDLRPEIERYVWDGLVDAVLGHAADRAEGLRILRLLKVANLLDLLPFGQQIKRAGRAPDTAALDAAIYGAIERAGDPAHDGRDLVSRLVRAADEGRSKWSYPNDRALRDEMIGFLCAFTDAPTAALCFALDHLGRNPDVRERVEREVAEVLGDRPVDAGDLQRLAYVRAVFNETLRLEPPPYVMRARQAEEDCLLGGYLVPRGTLVYIGMRVLHHRAECWERASEFRPERWLAASRRDGPPCPEHAYIPFGDGPHACAGADLAGMLFVLALATLTQRVRLDPVSSRPPKRENIGVGVLRFRVAVKGPS